MPRNIVQKILDDHRLRGGTSPGEDITVRIDQTLTQDATGTMAYLQLEALAPKRLATELSVSYVDHNTTQIGFENADDHRYLRSIARKYGIYFSPPGNGICHQVHLERFGAPGRTLLGSDSHTPTGGGIGMMAIGAGGLDVAVAMAKGEFSLTYPAVTEVRLAGRLRPWCAAKDVILTLLRQLTSKGNVGTVIEYTGGGLNSLTVPERATITNMGAELGVTTSVFPSDEMTRMFLRAQDREYVWREIRADDGARYARTIEIDLDSIEPMVACPHNPDRVVPVREVAGKPVNQVIIGSCTNSSYRDLMTAAAMMKGRSVSAATDFAIAPGSKQVLRMIADNGAYSELLAAGARFAETACGFCIGNSLAPNTDAVSIRTSNRNFQGRSGTPSAGLYLTSVETAAACALRGEITDPRALDLTYPDIPRPDRFTIDDRMIIPPAEKPQPVEIVRGPNIGTLPAFTELPADLSGEAAIKVGDKITTDHIMPAGDKLKYRSNVPVYAAYVFQPVDPSFSERCLRNKEEGRANIIIAGLSYGQGSSREHAALCPMYLGVKAVIAKSLERIHTANLINVGILPLTFVSASDYDAINQGDHLEFPDVRRRLRESCPVLLKNLTRNVEVELGYQLNDYQTRVLLAGGRLALGE